MNKKILITTILLLLTVTVSAEQKPYIKVEDAITEFADCIPYTDANGIFYVPVQFTAGAVGFQMDWNETDQKFTLSKEDQTASFQNSGTTLTVGEREVKMLAPAITINDQVYLPLKNFLDATGYAGEWNKITKEITLYRDFMEYKLTDGNADYYQYNLPDIWNALTFLASDAQGTPPYAKVPLECSSTVPVEHREFSPGTLYYLAFDGERGRYSPFIYTLETTGQDFCLDMTPSNDAVYTVRIYAEGAQAPILERTGSGEKTFYFGRFSEQNLYFEIQGAEGTVLLF